MNFLYLNVLTDVVIEKNVFREEVEELERKLHIERDRLPMLGLLTMDENLVETSGSAAAIPIPPPFTVNDKFELNKELACYALTVELTLPIDYVLLQACVLGNYLKNIFWKIF